MFHLLRGRILRLCRIDSDWFSGADFVSPVGDGEEERDDEGGQHLEQIGVKPEKNYDLIDEVVDNPAGDDRQEPDGKVAGNAESPPCPRNLRTNS